MKILILGQSLLVQGESYESSLLEVSLPENYYNGQESPIGTPMCGNFASILSIPSVNPSTVEYTLNPKIVDVIINPDTLEATLNPETLDASLIHPEVKIISPSPEAAILCNQAALDMSAETRTELGSCEVLPITSKVELAHSSVPEVHLEIQPTSDLVAAAESKVHKQEVSVQYGDFTRNEGDAEEVSAGIELAPDLSFKSSSLVYVSDFTEDSDVHEEDVERREGGIKDSEFGDRIQNSPNGGTITKDILEKDALENESLDSKLDTTEVRDEIEDFDEKVALVKAKLDLENSEEAKAVEAVMAGLNEEKSKPKDAARIEDGKADDDEKVVVEKHIQECIESVIEQGRGDMEGDVEGCKEGWVDIGHKTKRKLRRQRWTWL